MRIAAALAMVAVPSGAVGALALGQGATQPVMIQGSVLGADGQPAQSPILVYAPGLGEVAMARSGADGRFEVRARPTGDFATAVDANGGAVTLRVEVASDAERDPRAVLRVWKAGGWQGASEPVALRDPTPAAQARAAASRPSLQMARCVPTKPGDDTYPKRWTVIGRLNPNRATTASFTYGRERNDEISFSLNAAFEHLAIGGGQMRGRRAVIAATAACSTAATASTVGGIGFDTQSGYSSNVQVEYRFSGRRLRYYIYGTGGELDAGGEPKPSSWKQLWAGA